jgi:hypothetical protein
MDFIKLLTLLSLPGLDANNFFKGWSRIIGSSYGVEKQKYINPI